MLSTILILMLSALVIVCTCNRICSKLDIYHGMYCVSIRFRYAYQLYCKPAQLIFSTTNNMMVKHHSVYHLDFYLLWCILMICCSITLLGSTYYAFEQCSEIQPIMLLQSSLCLRSDCFIRV